MAKNKRSFFERLTGAVAMKEDEMPREEKNALQAQKDWAEEMVSDEEGQLAVDVYQTPEDIVIKTMVGGVRPEDLDISITRDMVTIKGTREAANEVTDDNF